MGTCTSLIRTLRDAPASDPDSMFGRRADLLRAIRRRARAPNSPVPSGTLCLVPNRSKQIAGGETRLGSAQRRSWSPKQPRSEVSRLRIPANDEVRPPLRVAGTDEVPEHGAAPEPRDPPLDLQPVVRLRERRVYGRLRRRRRGSARSRTFNMRDAVVDAVARDFRAQAPTAWKKPRSCRA